jgi:chromosome segregation ATPase
MDEHATQSLPTQEDELLGVIADVEKQLASLRTLKAEREEARAQLEMRAAEIAEKERALEAAAQRLAADIQACQRRGQEAARAEAELAARRDALQGERAALVREQEEAASGRQRAEADLKHRAETLGQREERLTEQARALSRERQAVEGQAASLVEREKALSVRFAEAEHARAQMAGLEDALRTARAESERHAAALETLRAELDAAARELAAARERQARDGQAQGALMAELEKRQAQLDRAGTELAAARAEGQQHAARASELQRELDGFKRQIIDRDGRIQELSAKLASATAKLKEVSHGIQEQAELVARARAADEQIRERDRSLAALRSQLHEAQERILELRSAGAEAGPELDELKARCVELEDALRIAHREMTSAIEENKDLRRRLSERPVAIASDIPVDIGEAVVRRHQRLRLMRQILREHAAKLNQAGEALRARYEQCEQVLSQRDAVVAAKAAADQLRSRLERLQGRAAGARALTAVFYAVLTLAALAGLAWALAGQIAPATFAARAAIAADTREMQASSDVLTEWQRYHESLLTDAAMIETAAERMGRRGMETLASGGALRDLLSRDLSHDSPTPGRLVLELRGQGAARTQRVLDTLITALVSQSNATRERRADGVGAMIAEPVSLGGGPIADQRLIYATVIFGGGLFACTVLALSFWRRMAAAKLRFEEEQQIDAVMDEASWRQAAESIRGR